MDSLNFKRIRMDKNRIKLVLTILSIIIFPFILLACFYFFCLKAASPETVCRNFLEVSKGSIYEHMLDLDTCVSIERQNRKEEGILGTAKRTKCQVKADNIDEYLKCAEN